MVLMSLLLPMPHSTDNVVPHIEYWHPYGFSTPPGTAIMCFSDLILFRAGRIGKPDLEQTFYNQEINRWRDILQALSSGPTDVTKKHQSIMRTITSRCFLSPSDVWLPTNFLLHTRYQRTPERQEWIEYAITITLSGLNPRSLPSDNQLMVN